MRATILFVHGTGVRAKGYRATLRTIDREVDRCRLDFDVSGCYWGEAEGACLRAGGVSIPGYGDSGGRQPTEAEEQLALWSLLQIDPWYELRLLRHRPLTVPLPFGQEAPRTVVRRAVDTLVPSPDVTEAFAAVGLDMYLNPALEAVRSAPELDDAVATAPPEPLEHRRAIARAVVAYVLVAAVDDGLPAVDGTSRDALVFALTAALKGDGLGIGDFLLRSVKGMALRLVTHKLTGDRGSISDGAAPMAGDVLRFLAHGDGARRFIRAAIEDLGAGPTYLLAHSLGGIMCADLLVRDQVPGVAGLITVGSQTPFMYEIGAFPGLSYPEPLPDHMPRWLNVYDRRDILSYRAQPVFGDRVSDKEVDNGQPFHWSHSAYWTNPELWTAVGQFVS